MSRDARAGTFLFDPQRYSRDPAVLAMSLPGRAAYSMLFCAAWGMANPGVIYPANDTLLASLALVDGPTWKRVREEVAKAFTVDAIAMTWTLNFMVRTHAQQNGFVIAQAEAGRKGAYRRWHGQANGDPIASPLPDQSGRQSGRDGPSVSGSEKITQPSQPALPRTSHARGES